MSGVSWDLVYSSLQLLFLRSLGKESTEAQTLTSLVGTVCGHVSPVAMSRSLSSQSYPAFGEPKGPVSTYTGWSLLTI